MNDFINQGQILLISIFLIGCTKSNNEPFASFLKQLLIAKSDSVVSEKFSSPFYNAETNLQHLMEMHCNEKGIEVLLNYNNRVGLLSTMLESVLANSTLLLRDCCHATSKSLCDNLNFRRQDETLKLSFAYENDCVYVMPNFKNDTDSIIYNVSVLLKPSFNQTIIQQPRSFSLNCILPSERSRKKTDHQIHVFKGKNDVRYVKNNQMVEIGSTLYIQGKPHSDWYSGSNIHSYPMNCWIEQESETLSRRMFFIRNGCPAANSQGRGLCRVHHYTDDSPKIGLELNDRLLPDFSEERNITIKFTCEYFSCSLKHDEYLWLTPKCPAFHACTGETLVNISRIAINTDGLYAAQSIQIFVVPKAAASNDACKSSYLQSLQTSKYSGYPWNTYGIATCIVMSFTAGVLIMGIIVYFQHYSRRRRGTTDVAEPFDQIENEATANLCERISRC